MKDVWRLNRYRLGKGATENQGLSPDPEAVSAAQDTLRLIRSSVSRELATTLLHLWLKPDNRDVRDSTSLLGGLDGEEDMLDSLGKALTDAIRQQSTTVAGSGAGTCARLLPPLAAGTLHLADPLVATHCKSANRRDDCHLLHYLRHV